MLSFIPSQDPNTIAMEFEGKAEKEDLVKVEQEIKKRFPDKEKFNLYVIVHEVDGATPKALMEEAKVDMKRWGQYNKMAVVSDKNWLEKMTDAGDVLPGIEAKHFRMDEAAEAWEWIKSG
ncbi:SpoIIAA family protein [Planococcus salinarum]|uniref:STAS/SEC14 domain-containing protein n=1 Tax=Planococcus salinarum TaxID=622695 RepID=UPI000E3BC86D|nr:STAS/SEC14 domain-containing protein [Planococcus salinarum]TAA72832.1 STAS/SEC14 domain-containing protein [Planococcus salinarum]